MSSTGGEIKSVSTWLEQNDILVEELEQLDKDNKKLEEKGQALNDAIENSENQLKKIQDEISAKENAIKDNKLLEAASLEAFEAAPEVPPEVPPEAPAFEESEKPSQKAPIKGKASGMFDGLAGVQLKKVKPEEVKKTTDKEEANFNNIINELKTPTGRLHKLLMKELDSQTKDKLNDNIEKLENFEMNESQFVTAIKALSSEIRSNIVVAYNKAKQAEQASLKAQQRERDEKRQSDPFVRIPREIAPDSPRIKEQRREILQKLLQSRGINDKLINVEPSIYSTDHQNIDNLKKTIAGASDGLKKLIAASAKNEERKKALLSQAAEIGGKADQALKKELHAFRQKVKDEMEEEEKEKEEVDRVAPSFSGKLTDIINKIPQAEQAKFLQEQQELLFNDIDLAIKIQHARDELTDLQTALDKAIKNKMNVLQAELGNINQRYQAFAQAKVARGEEQPAEVAKSASDENVGVPEAPPMDRKAEEAAKPEILVAPPETPIPEAPRRTSVSIPPIEVKAKREREVSPETPSVEVPEAPDGAPDLSVPKSFKPTVTKVKTTAPEAKPVAPEVKPAAPEITPVAAEPKLAPPEVKPREAAEPKVPTRAPSFKADTLPGFRKSMDKEEAEKPSVGPAPTPERKLSLDSQRPPEKDKTRISLEQNMPLLIKVMLESEANIAKDYASKRKEATRWFQKGSRVDEVKFIEEAAKLAKDTRKFRDTTGEEKDLTDTDRLLAYIGALELIQWKLQTESRFFERKSTLAKMVDDRIKNSMDLLRKNKEYSDKDQWPESTIHTLAYQKLYAIKPTSDAAKTYKSSIWEAKEDLWPRIGKNIEDFDINKIRGTKKEKRKPGV